MLPRDGEERAAREQHASRQQLKRDGADGVDVASLVPDEAAQLLRRHVLRRSNGRTDTRDPGVGAIRVVSQPEIENGDVVRGPTVKRAEGGENLSGGRALSYCLLARGRDLLVTTPFGLRS